MSKLINSTLIICALTLLTLLGYIASIAPAAAKTEKQIIEFDAAENMTRFAFDDSHVFEDGMPAHGNVFITEGYIYPKGTLNGSNGVLANGEPEFPEKVIGTWICRGWFIGDGAHTKSGAWVITTQVYNFGTELGLETLVLEGYELADMNVPIQRAVTGGTGRYQLADGQANQVFLGLNATEGVNLRLEVEAETVVEPATASSQN